MPEKTKPKEDTRKIEEQAVEKTLEEIQEIKKDDRNRERQEKSYYYDDAHGYEIYNPDEDAEDS